ncbi:MAG: Heme/hemopexin-binding protein [Herbaspirillum frisingense]|uniref:Heme/hemopexin-binding protein n=1 Tax=Herbaspirillum frisingense TaxID=92645 RepID=A0A7V8JUR2_9BURK|nr:MAG: Heme/hemopexin-binding protein [Herbaspirillum frisingense]
MKPTSTSADLRNAQPKIELLPPSITLRVGRRRMTLTWRPRKALPRLLSGLLHRSWRRVLAPTLRLSVAAAAVCSAWQTPVLAAAPAAGTLPTGGSALYGNVSFDQSGNTLNINQASQQAIARFQTFSIGSGAVVNVNQPGAAASLLAKVAGGDISQIYGKLTATGTVVLYNPNGVVIGPGGTVDATRFIATRLGISDSDFLAGRLNFAKQGTAGAVDNQGTIQSATGGSVYLIGSSVSNSGIIKSPQGEVILAAGETVTLADTATPGVTVNVTGSAGNVTNLGSITAEAGRIGVAAGLINNSGTINASSVVREGGRIFLRASNSLTTTASSNISADGATGGNITLFGEQKAYLDGDVSAIGTAGVGGFVDTSSHQLDVIKLPKVGLGGTWLIDPYNLIVGNDDILNGGGGIITSNGSAATISASTVSALLSGGISVTLLTGGGGAQAGDITVNNAIVKNGFGSNTILTLNAYNNITLNANITDNSSCGTLSVTLHSNYLGASTASSHVVNLNNAAINLTGGSLVLSEGISGRGDLSINGSAGLITLGSGGSLSARNVTVGNGSRLLLSGASIDLSGTLSNSGTTNISGAASATIQSLTNNNQMKLADGTVEFNSTVTNTGTLSLGDGANILLDGGMTNSGTLRNDFTVGSATINAGAAVSNTNTGTVSFTGGSCATVNLAGSGAWSNSGNLNISSNTNFTHALSNSGTVTLDGYATLTLQGGMTNSGLLRTVSESGPVKIITGGDVTNTANGILAFGGTCTTTNVSGNGTWNNLGNITINGSNHQFSFGGKMLVNNGTLNVVGGGHDINNLMNNGNVSLTDSASLTLSGGTMNANMAVQNGSSLTLNGSTLTGGFAATGGGAMYWRGNITLSGPVTLGSDGPTLTFDDGQTMAYIAAADGNAANSLTTRKQVYFVNGANVGLDVNTTWINYGQIQFSSDMSQQTSLTMSSGSRLQNMAGGVIALGQSDVWGSIVMNSGSHIDNSGTMNLGYGTISGDNSGAPAVIFNAANGTLNAGSATVGNGSYPTDGEGGLLYAGGVYIDNAGLLNAGSASLALYNNVTGTVNVSGSLNAANFRNDGALNLQNYGAVTGLIENHGNVTLTDGTSLSASDSLNNYGNISMSGASSLSYIRVSNYGTVRGNGTISVNVSESGGFHNSGTVAPGGDGAIGRLTITGGSFVQESDGMLLIDIASASSYDTINAQNGITLGGTLKTSLLGSYGGATVAGTPDSFSIFGSDMTVNGYFRNVLGTVYQTAGGKAMMKARYNQNGNGLVLALATGEDFSSATSGDWGSLETWNMGYLPTAVDRVTVAGGSDVYTNGTDIVDRLTVANSASMSVNRDASLTVNGGSQIAGTFNANSGSNVTLGGGNQITGTFNARASSNVALNGGNGSLGGEEGGEGGELFTNLVVVSNTRAPNVSIANANSTLHVNMNAGNLTLSGDALFDELTLNGGNVTSATRLVVGHSFNQTGGSMTLADAALTKDNGAMSVGDITARNLVLYAGDGSIVQNGGSVLHVKQQLVAGAREGINLGNSGNQIAAFAANNTGTGDIVLTNSLNTTDASQVTLNGVNTASGNITIDNTGGLVTAAIGSGAGFTNNLTVSGSTRQAIQRINSTGKVNAATGSVKVTTHSPLTIGTGGVGASGGITLVAGASSGSNDVLTINGVLVSLGGNISLSAGDAMTINANISTSPPGTALFSVQSGALIGYAQGVTITDVNGTRIPVPITTPNTPSTLSTPTGSSATSQTQQAMQQQQNVQTQNLQTTVNSAQLAAGTQAATNAVQQTSSSSGQTVGGTSGNFGDDGENKQAGKKPLPMCT